MRVPGLARQLHLCDQAAFGWVPFAHEGELARNWIAIRSCATGEGLLNHVFNMAEVDWLNPSTSNSYIQAVVNRQ